MDKLVTEMSSSSDSIVEFIEELSEAIEPISMTLLVMNEATWKIMERKPRDADCMLPMVTIPWFHWSENAAASGNPRGIQRQDHGTTKITCETDGKRIVMSGTGGNFCGILEGRVAYATGVGSFTDIYGPLMFWNELSGTGFLVGFGVIIGMIALIMFLILKAFSVEEGAW